MGGQIAHQQTFGHVQQTVEALFYIRQGKTLCPKNHISKVT